MDESERLCKAADEQLKELEASGEVSKKWLDQFAILVKNNVLLQQKVADLEHFAERMSESSQATVLKVQKLESDQALLDWKIQKLLSALSPEEYPDPGPDPTLEVEEATSHQAQN